MGIHPGTFKTPWRKRLDQQAIMEAKRQEFLAVVAKGAGDAGFKVESIPANEVVIPYLSVFNKLINGQKCRLHMRSRPDSSPYTYVTWHFAKSHLALYDVQIAGAFIEGFDPLVLVIPTDDLRGRQVVQIKLDGSRSRRKLRFDAMHFVDAWHLLEGPE